MQFRKVEIIIIIVNLKHGVEQNKRKVVGDSSEEVNKYRY